MNAVSSNNFYSFNLIGSHPLDDLIQACKEKDVEKFLNLLKQSQVNLNAVINIPIDIQVDQETLVAYVYNLLTYTSYLGQVQIVQQLIEKLNDQQHLEAISLQWNLAPMPFLAYLADSQDSGQVECAKLLIQSGVKVNDSVKDVVFWDREVDDLSKSSISLLVALQKGNIELVQLMVYYGAELNSSFIQDLKDEAIPSDEMIQIWKEAMIKRQEAVEHIKQSYQIIKTANLPENLQKAVGDYCVTYLKHK